jgi:hypothetical protein
MILSNKIFIFFLCDWKGACYFLDSNNNVQSGNLGQGTDYSLPEGPANWRDIELSFIRNEHYIGYNRSFSPELKFVRSSATIIRTLLYTNGPEQEIYFVATKWNSDSGIYELYYQGLLDFTQVSEDDPITGITIKTIEGGLPKLIKSYENTVFEIPCDGSITENKSILINGIMFASTFNYTLINQMISANTSVLPLVFSTEWGNDIDIEKGAQKYYPFDHTNAGDVSTVEQSGNYCFLSQNSILQANPQGGLRIKGYIILGGTINNFQLVVYFSDGSQPNGLAITTIQNTNAQTLDFDTTIDCPAGAGLYFVLQNTSESNGQVLGGTLQLIFNSQFEDTYAYAISPNDYLNLLLQKIFTSASNAVKHNVYYQYISNLLANIPNKMLTCGASLRGNTGAVIKMSLSQLFDTFNPSEMAALGYETVPDPLKPPTGPNSPINYITRLFFENREVVYNSNNVDLDLGEVAHLKITPAEELLISNIKIGYTEQKYDFKQGNDEINTTAQYKTPFDKIKKELTLISASRGDPFGIEATRFLTGTTQTSNNKSDNDVFIINIDLQTPQTDDVTIAAVLAQIIPATFYYQDQLITDSTLNLLGWPVIFDLILGTAFAGNFILVNGSFTPPTNQNQIIYNNSKIEYTNNVTSKITGTCIIKGTINSICEVQQVGPGKVFVPYSTGTFIFTFSVYQNNKVINSIVLSITLGKAFTITIPFNASLNLGDQIWLDWHLNCNIQGNQFYYSINGQNQEVLPTVASGQFTQCTFSLTTPGELVYGVKRANYDQISSATMTNPLWAYNIEDMTPARMITNHFPWLRSIFYNMAQYKFSFLTSDKSHDLMTILNGVTFQEGVDIPISNMNQNIMFLPFWLTFNTQIPITFNDLMSKARNAHIHFTFYGIDFWGFPQEVKVKPALNESQQWKMLCSPLTNINNLINFDLSGLNLLNLPKMSTFISFFNPLKFYPASPVQDARYNFRHMDSDFFINQTAFYGQTKNYFQKWQNSDTISLQVLSSAIAPCNIKIYTDSGILYQNYNFDSIINPIIQNWNNNNPGQPARRLFQININLSTFITGTYYAVITVGVGSAIDTFISEGFQVAPNWPVTLYLQYTNSFNRNSTFFQGSTPYNFNPAVRHEGWLDDYKPKSHTAAFEDQPADMKIINSIDYRSHKYNVGTQDGIPPFMIDLIAKAFGLDTLTSDGLGLAKMAEDTEWEMDRPQGWSKSYWSLEVRETENVGGVQAVTSGSEEDEILTSIFVDLQGFGEINEASNIVPILKLDT